MAYFPDSIVTRGTPWADLQGHSCTTRAGCQVQLAELHPCANVATRLRTPAASSSSWWSVPLSDTCLPTMSEQTIYKTMRQARRWRNVPYRTLYRRCGAVSAGFGAGIRTYTGPGKSYRTAPTVPPRREVTC